MDICYDHENTKSFFYFISKVVSNPLVQFNISCRMLNCGTVALVSFFFLYTPHNKVVGGYTGFTMSVRLSVHL